MLYILNNRVFPKWFYSYDSSVTRTQREMTHHLVAYVFQVLPGHVPMTQQNQQQVSERNNVVVLARQASPGFLLVSYRRSGGSSKNPGCLLPAIDTSTADNMQAASSEILSASWKVHEHQQQHLQQQQWLQQQRFQQRLQIEQETRQRQQPGRLQSTQTRPSAVAAPFARSLNIQTIRDDGSDNQTPAANLTIPSEVAGDVEFWQREVEATAPGFREKEQQLLILWYFLEYVSMDDLGVNSDSLTAHDGLSIDMNFFAFDDRDGRRDDVTPGVNTTAVHRASLSLVLDQDTETMGEGDPRYLFIIVQGTVCSARAPGVEMSEMSSSGRAVLWNQLSWMSILEVQAVAL
ncbi:hypothetical protein PI124_g22404 [Phytophthora idaei]|nr:hypothetical protein PI124_g22404 [Phytophthora idaei]